MSQILLNPPEVSGSSWHIEYIYLDVSRKLAKLTFYGPVMPLRASQAPTGTLLTFFKITHPLVECIAGQWTVVTHPTMSSWDK